MNKPTLAGIKSIPLEMELGIYKWCSCGLSKTQPFCDDSHIGTGFLPVEVEITEARKYSWCACKLSGKQPFCDGTHKQLPEHIAYMEMIAAQAVPPIFP
ncbi:MAG: CDGSH iron-sulfur domain-containing protein [Ignavibacteriae bacterium]|nr:CDGSH iron-sulfur domain-containing protein [Ignavibacteriota bacterium]